MSEAEPSKPLLEDELVKSDGHGGQELELLPLPTEFDPSANFGDLIEVVAAEEDGEAFERATRDRLDLPAVSLVIAEAPSRIESTGEQDQGATKRDEEPQRDGKDGDDPTLREILQSLARTQGADEGKRQEPQTAFSSPISDLPDLPTELPPSPEVRTVTLPPAQFSQSQSAATRPNGSAHPAESSATATRRAATEVDPAGGKTSGRAKRKSKAPASYFEHWADLEELNELGDIKAEGKSMSSKGGKNKKLKGLDGQPIKPSKPAGKRIDAAMGIQPDGDDPPEKIKPRAKVISDAQIIKSLKGQTRDIQMSPCLRPRYAKWGKCTQCISKHGGDSCRFRDFRVFEIDPDTTEIKGPGWFESTKLKEEMTALPTDFNVPLREQYMRETERTVAPLLLPLITRELRHCVRFKAIKREVDTAKHRAVCDFCSSTIFGGYFLCKKCGRDFCLQCERYFSESLETIRDSPWDIPDAARPRLLRCTGGVERIQGKIGSKIATQFHVRPDLQPVSRFDAKELKQQWVALAEFVLRGIESLEQQLQQLGVAEDEAELKKLVEEWMAQRMAQAALERQTQPAVSEEDIAALYQKRTNPAITPISDPAGLEDLSLPFLLIPADRLNNETFDTLWARGEPIIVDGVGQRMKYPWTPDTFIERFGAELCVIVDCQTNAFELINIAQFFEMWKNPEGRKSRVLKLKDWPSTNDFQSAYPDLYNDFCDSLPVPDYTRREGVLNLYSHFPPGPTKPDIGPKMYNAFEGKESSKGFGSTRLHMDVADAINVMLYASPRNDGQPGCAVWDLFRADDADKLRKFLRKKYSATHIFTDPIHSQLFYLNADLRKELLDKHGVVSWRVYQHPGQAVFIPAGCAHQVCNLADCIKIALDFVSPHNVTRCQQLVSDFRKENYVRAWKEDVLQLYNVMWYAWLSIRETRARRFKEAAEEEAAITARAAHLECLQNGNHPDLSMTKTLGLQTTSPGRNGLFEPAVSSVRDEPAQPVHSMDGVEPPHEVSLGGPPEGDQPEYDVSISTSIPVNGDNAAVSFEDGAKTTDPKRILAHQLLEAALSRPDPAPEPYKSERKPVPPSPKPTPPPKNLSIKDMIKLKMLPIDFAVNAARLAMGEGAEDDDEDFGDLPGVSAMGGTGMEMEMQVDPAGDDAVEPPFVASLDIL